MAAPFFALRYALSKRGFRRGQATRPAATTAITPETAFSDQRSASKPPASSEGDPLETVLGRKIATLITHQHADSGEEERLDDRCRGHSRNGRTTDARPASRAISADSAVFRARARRSQ